MITKILISWLKKNKVQLETEHTAWKFNVALVLESLLGSFCASVGLNMVLDYFIFHRVDNFNIFGLVTLLYGIANMKILLIYSFVQKELTLGIGNLNLQKNITLLMKY